MASYVVHHVIGGTYRKTTVQADQVRLGSDGSVEGRCWVGLYNTRNELLGSFQNVEAVYLEGVVVDKSVKSSIPGRVQTE
jgi:hypothetical protein